MSNFDLLMHGFSIALTWDNMLIALIGSLLGTVIGLLPGLGPINGVALLLPFAFGLGLEAVSALVLLASVYMGCEYGGRISAILMNVPGDAGAMMTTLDGYPMAQKGEGAVALSISAVSSFVGSMVAIVGITLFAPALADWAVAFGPAQYFALIVFAIAAISSLFGTNTLATIFASLIGILLSLVGVDAITGVYRFTFDEVHLFDGIHFATLIIGLFSISEVLMMLEKTKAGQSILSGGKRKIFNLKELCKSGSSIVRSSFFGFFIGVLPGAGASIASAVAYSTEKKITKDNQDFGKGDIRGVAAPEAANNAAACGSFIPMLTLGVPGSGTTAVMLGALTLYKIQPGPQLFQTNPDLVWGLISSLFLANILLLIINLPLAGLLSRLLTIPTYVLMSVMLIASIVGVYSLSSSMFELMLMLSIGVVGYILRKMNIPLAPIVLGFVLGAMLEDNVRRALSISGGDLSILVRSPISIGLWVLTILVLILPWLSRRRKRNVSSSSS